MIKSFYVLSLMLAGAPAWSSVTTCTAALSPILESTEFKPTPFTSEPRGNLVNLPRREAADPFGFFGEALAADPSLVITNFGGYKIYLGGKIFSVGLGDDGKDIRITALDNSDQGRRFLTTLRVGPKIVVQLIINVDAEATNAKVWMRARTPADELSRWRSIATFGAPE